MAAARSMSTIVLVIGLFSNTANQWPMSQRPPRPPARLCKAPILGDSFLLPREIDALDIGRFNAEVADKFYSALIKGRPVSSPKVVDVVQKYSSVVDGGMEYIGQGLYENGTCAGNISKSTPDIIFTIESRRRMVFKAIVPEGEPDNIFYTISSNPSSYYWNIACFNYTRGSRRCDGDYFVADLYIYTTADGNYVPFDVEASGRDLREATCLTTTSEQVGSGSFGWYMSTGYDTPESCNNPFENGS